MYRGWYKGEREFGSAKVPWEFCLAEWNAQFLGDRAYQISESREGEPALGGQAVPRGQPLAPLGLPAPRRARPTSTSASRSSPATSPTTGGPSAPGASPRISPWEYEHFWKLRDGVDTSRQGVQGRLGEPAAAGVQPGLHSTTVRADGPRLRAHRTGCRRPRRRRCIRNNRPLLAYIGGKPPPSRARTTTSSPARRSRSSSSSSTTRARR